jgi:acetoin utilization deacetylase AcuC-like enzyme
LHFNRFTFFAARLAVGGVVELVNAVTSKNAKTTRAIALLVRPPGHHAGVDEAMGKVARVLSWSIEIEKSLCSSGVRTHDACSLFKGFCYFNNIAVAAKHALSTNRASIHPR